MKMKYINVLLLISIVYANENNNTEIDSINNSYVSRLFRNEKYMAAHLTISNYITNIMLFFIATPLLILCNMILHRSYTKKKNILDSNSITISTI